VTPSARARSAALARVVEPALRTAHVIDVPVRVHDRVHAGLRPGADLGVHPLRESLETRVEQHQPVARVQTHDVRERLDQRHPGRDLGQLAGRQVGRAQPLGPLVDVARREAEQVCHVGEYSHDPRPWTRTSACAMLARSGASQER